MEVLSVQNQYPAHFALATGKYLSKPPKNKKNILLRKLIS